MIREFFKKNKDRLPAFLAVLVTLSLMVGGIFSKLSIFIFIFGLSIIFFFIAAISSSIIMKSLVRVAAEFSLLILLAQSYCDSGVKLTDTGNASLNFLLTFGILFIVYKFFSAIRIGLRKNKEQFKEVGWIPEGRMMYTLLVLSIGVFIFALYQIARPIILGLCIY